MLPLALALLMAGSPLDRVREDRFGVAEGLMQASVTAIEQSPEGWLQLGTFAGVARFDGIAFEVFDTSDWSSIRVTAMTYGPDGSAWVGTQDGSVVRIDPGGRDTVLPRARALSGHAIWDLAADDDGVWAVAAAGAAHFGQDWAVVDGAAASTAVLHDAGVTWIGGTHGLLRLEGEAAAWRRSAGDLSDVGVGEVLALGGHTGALLVGGEDGLVELGPDGARRLDDERTTHVLRTSDGNVWAANGRRLRVVGYDGVREIASGVRRLFEDREGDVWVGTDAHGAIRLQRTDWELVRLGAPALPVLETSDGRWLAGLGCDDGGLAEVVAGDVGTSMTGGCVRALAETADGVWVAADHELGRLREDGGFEAHLDIGFPILVVHPVADGLVVGTDNGGAYLVQGTAATRLPVTSTRVLAVATAPDRVLWFGTHDGVERLAGGRITRWGRAEGAPAGAIRALRVDADGTVLMGSYGGGLGILRNGVLRRLTVGDGLLDNVVSAILDDGRGALWLHGNRGLSRLYRSDLETWLADPTTRVTVRRWNSPEGMGGGQPAGIVAKDGALLVPTIEGLVRLDSYALYRNPVVPEVLIRYAAVDDTPLQAGHAAAVPAGRGHLRIDFTAVMLRHPELVRFEYRVQGPPEAVPGSWRAAPENRSIAWAGFAPGHYIVELRAANEEGTWSEPTALEFTLAAPWYEWWTLRGFALGLLLAAGFGAHRLRTRGMMRHAAELRREVEQRREAESALRHSEQRLAEAERMEAVGRLAGGIAHDFNNLLTAILGAAQRLRTQHDPALVDGVERCVDRGATLTRQLLAFARRQQLEPRAVLTAEVVRAVESMIGATLPRGTLLTEDIPRTLAVHVDPGQLELALINLILNARDSLGGAGRIRLRAAARDGTDPSAGEVELPPAPPRGWVTIEVADDGRGMPPHQLAHITEPFFNTRTGRTGLGLPSVHGFAAQSGGALRLESRVGEGTTATIWLPAADPPAPRRITPMRPSARSHVVVCDDDDMVRDVIALILRNAGYVPHAFQDADAALAALENGTPCDLLVTDVLMPGPTGPELAATLRTRDPELPVLFISGYTEDAIDEQLPGMLLHKPFRSDQLVRAVRAAFERVDTSD